jgi:rod shape-determining protein MreD
MLTRGVQDRVGGRFRKRINRAPSPLLAAAVPWVSVMLLSMSPYSPMITSSPLLPPLGFMALLGWRMLRPGMLPIWAGFPLGAWDDLFSGQPFGSAILLWSGAMILMEFVDVRVPWRGFFQDWLVASGLIIAYLVLSLAFANMTGGSSPLRTIAPQLVLSIVAHPIVTRLVAMLDRLRLVPIRTVGR